MFTAAYEAARRHKPFSNALPYAIKERNRSRVVAAVASIHPDAQKPAEAGAALEAVHGLLNRIKDGSINFWNPDCQHEFTSQQTAFLASKGYACIALCFALQDTELHHTFLRRFTRVVVYRLTQTCGRTASHISEDFQEAGLRYDKSLESLEKDITAFIHAGRRYTKFAEALGGFGALFFLPRVGHTV